jgi:tetratricopeptide (TPR) repeat protein
MLLAQALQSRWKFWGRNEQLILMSLAIILSSYSITKGAAQFGSVQPGSGITVFGRVSLPDGKPAIRVKVILEGPRGLARDTLTDDQGNYEIRGLISGRYRITATNPNAPEQYSDPAESDTTRAYASRLQINVHLRLPLTTNNNYFNPGTVNVNEAAQNIPKIARKAFEKGLNLQQENQIEQALSQYNQAIKLHPEYFQALTERANLFMQLNRLLEAEADFAQALKLNGKYVPAWRGISYCQIQQKNFAAAVRNLETAFALEPNAPMTLLLLGYGNLSLNRYEEAKQCLQEALRLDEKSAARAHLYLAEIFAHEHQFKQAADKIREYLKAKPEAADAVHLKELEQQWRRRGEAAKTQP